jgi:hypothetical protein
MVLACSAALAWYGLSGPDTEERTPGGPPSELAFYDWSANLLGPARTVNPFTGTDNPRRLERASSRLRQRWIDNDRAPTSVFNRAFIVSGAEPTREDAERIAATANTNGTAPQGAIVVSESPSPFPGSPVPDPEDQAYYALNDDPALTSRDITNLALGSDDNGRPTVSVRFSEDGQSAFEQMTRKVAERGPTAFCGPGGACRAIFYPDSIAIIYQGRVLNRPNIDYLRYPNGLDGQNGYEIHGFKDEESARSLIDSLSAD